MNDQLTEPIDSHDEDLFAGPAPAWPKWIGGFAIGWGGLMLTCTGIMSAYILYLPKMMEPMLEGAPLPEAMQLGLLDWSLMAVGILALLLLIVGGVLCVMRNPLSRVLILIWGISSIPFSLVNYVRQMDAQESMRAWAQQYPDNTIAQNMTAGGQSAQQIGEVVGLAMTIVLGIIVPAFFVVWFGFIKTKPAQMLGAEEEII
tara:strand:+ start:97199 stop:97804 length:606 start_codon:yes stop_codon:yes gene_type:complete